MPIKALHKYYLCICYLFCIFIFSFYHSALLFLYADIIFNFPDSASDSYSVGLTIFALSWLLLQYYRYIWYLLIFLKKILRKHQSNILQVSLFIFCGACHICPELASPAILQIYIISSNISEKNIEKTPY